MTTRRDFIRDIGTAAISGLLLSQSQMAEAFIPKYPMPEPGIQLFTFFNSIDDDVNGTLKRVAAIGYKNIESAFSKKGGYYGYKPKDFSTALSDMGLKWKSHHVLGAPFKLPPGAKLPDGPDGKPITIPPMRNLQDNMQELVDEAAEGGVEYLVCANAPFGTADEIKNSIETLNKTTEAASKAGLLFAYHNHDAEFQTVEGTVPYEAILNDTDPKMKLELDIAWSVKGGADPIALFKKNKGRFHLWHVKDLDASRETILPVGEGTINYAAYFAAAKEAGLKYYFIEHDMPKDAFASITTSLKALRNIIK